MHNNNCPLTRNGPKPIEHAEYCGTPSFAVHMRRGESGAVMARANYKLGDACRCTPGEHTILACEAYSEGLEQGRKEATAEIVAFIRHPDKFWPHSLADIIERGDHTVQADTNRETGSLVEKNPGPTASASSDGVDTHSQGASLEAVNVARPRSDPRSAPASDTRLSSYAKADTEEK